jgi:tetratricopeptide (TPR) repeat protein
MKKKVCRGLQAHKQFLLTAYCLRRSAYCLLPTVFFLLLYSRTFSQAQPSTHLDSLENAIKNSEGTKKADLMIESIYYQWKKSKNLYREPFVDASREAYQFSRNILYNEGMAESGTLLIQAFSDIHQRDSVQYYLAETLRLFTALNDSANIAGIYRLYAGSEKGDGNYEQALSYIEKALDIGKALKNINIQISVLEYSADIYKEMGNFSKEEEIYLKLIELNTRNQYNSSRVLISLARYYINLGNYAKGIRYSLMADSAIGELEDAFALEYPDKTLMQAKMKGNVARAYRLWGYYDSALVWHRRAIAGMESASHMSNVDIPNQWEGMGAVYTQKGMYDSARFYLDKSAYSREEARDFLGAGESYDGLGYMCWLIGDEEGAVNYYMKAIRLKSDIPAPQASYRRATLMESQSVTYLRLGQAYASRGMTESALRGFDKSLGLCREIGYRRGEAEVLIEIGKLRNNNLQAEKDLKDALRIFTEIDYKPGQADAISSLGDLYCLQADFEQSLEYYKQSERILLNTENPIMLADVWMKIGLALSDSKRYDKAEKYMVMALNQAKKFNLFQQIMNAEKVLSDLYRHTDKKALALDNFLGYLDMRDSVNRQKTYYLLADLQSRNKSDINQRQIELLRKEDEVKDLKISRSNAYLTGAFGLFMLLILLSASILRTLRLKDAQNEALRQQKLFRSRMNPDYINYSLGNVRKLVDESKITEASDYITSFSRMMQSMLEGSRQELIVFSKGITMLKSYFELIKLSQEGSFDYEINIDPGIDVDEIMVPSFLEEVIAPGFKAESGHRFIKLMFIGSDKKINISVESRGYIANSAGLSDQDLNSLKMIRARLSGMEKRYHVRLGFEIVDLYNEEGQLDGKRLDFEVPAVYD